MNVHFDPTRNPIVSVRDGEAFANSRDVASFFGKPHDAIIKEIEALLVAVPDMSGRSIVRTEDGPNAFDMTKDGFSLLGKHFKTQRDIRKAVAFYQAFNDAKAASVRTEGMAVMPSAAEPLTMSSREISELTGKQHKNVLADIRRMLDGLEMGSAEFSADVPDAYGRSQPGYQLPKDLTLTLVAGYDVKLRKRIIDRWLELEGMAGGSTAPLIGADMMAELSSRMHTEIAEHQSAVTRDVEGTRGAVLGFLQNQVARPLVALRQYLDDRFMAARERDKMVLGILGDVTQRQGKIEQSIGTVLTFARRALDPEAFIRSEWRDVDDVYRMAGVSLPIPRRNILSTQVHNALDGFCKANHRQEDMRVWPCGGRQVSYWRKTAVQAWLRGGGARKIKAHYERHAKPPQGVLPFRKPDQK